MRDAIRAALLAASFVAMPTAAFSAGWQFGVQGGASIPTGDFFDSQHAETGSIFSISADYLLGEMWTLGANFSMTGNNHANVGPSGSIVTVDEHKYSTTQFGAHARYIFPVGGNIKPFGILGAGSTEFREKETVTYSYPGTPVETYNRDSGRRAVSGKIGAGATWWPSATWGIGCEADYNYMVLEDGLPYFALSAGAMFRIPGAK